MDKHLSMANACAARGCEDLRFSVFCPAGHSDSEGHRFESCRAYRRKPLANQRFAGGFALPFFAGAAGVVHCLVHQSPFFHAFRHRNGLPCAASLPLPTAPRPPLCLVVRSPAHGVDHHASSLQLHSTPLPTAAHRCAGAMHQPPAVRRRAARNDCPLSGSSFSARHQGCRFNRHPFHLPQDGSSPA